MPRPLLILGAVLLVIVGVPATPAAAQDAVKIGGIWAQDVTVQGVVEGRLVFVSAAGGDVAQPLARVEGLRLARYPQLAQAGDALEQKKPADAARLLAQVKGAAREPWVRQYVQARLVAAHDAAGQAFEATQAFLELTKMERVPVEYLGNPPVQSLTAAPEAVQRRAKALLTDAARTAPKEGPVAENLAKLVEVVANLADQAPAPVAPGTPGTPAATPGNGAAPATPGAAPAAAGGGAVVLPAELPEDDAVKLLKAGKFADADAALTQALQTEGDLSRKLYLHGLAKLGQADAAHGAGDAEKAQKLYKDAGLSFMRVVAYFPRSKLMGPALVEVGYVHHRIGRPDLAQRYFQNASMELGTEEEEPRYHERLRKLNAELTTAEPAAP